MSITSKSLRNGIVTLVLLTTSSLQLFASSETVVTPAVDHSAIILDHMRASTNDVCFFTAGRMAQKLASLGYKLETRFALDGADVLENVTEHSFALKLIEVLSQELDSAEVSPTSPIYYGGGIAGHAFFFEKGIDTDGVQYVRFIQSWGGRFFAKVWLDLNADPVAASDWHYEYNLEHFAKVRAEFGGAQKLKLGDAKFNNFVAALKNMHDNNTDIAAGEAFFGAGAVKENNLVQNYRKGNIAVFKYKAKPIQ